MKKTLLLISTFIIHTVSSFAVLPGINKIWYFGNHAGVDFTQTPVALTNGATNTYDNVGVISDDQGSLLFYCDGETIWNKNHQIMLNGSGINGSVTGGQPALIIKQPDEVKGNSYLYYVFNVPEYASGGLYYSVVDMSLDSGRGEVISKNNLLNSSTCEKLAAIYNLTTNSYWLIMHEFGNSNFKSYSIDETGLNTTPVISSIGDVNNGGSYGSLHGSCGQLVISENGSRIANAMNFAGKIQLFDFDISSGIVSNPINITNRTNAWGVAFSPDGNVLYTTSWTNANIFQYDLTSYNPTDINASILNVGSITNPNSSYRAGYLKLAPDGKIYIAKYSSPYLAAITNPDAVGLLCSFVDNALNLGTGISTAGLATTVVIPNSITSISELSSDNNIVYPNPSSDFIKIKPEFMINEEINFHLSDLTGRKVFIDFIIEENSININVESLAKGQYFYSIDNGKKSTNGKILVQ